ncbi:MAG: acetate--CoA ligase family protein [Myxococcales bacterium]
MTTRSCPVFCETAELAVEAAAIAQGLALGVQTQLSSNPLDAAARAARPGEPAVALCLSVPEPAALVSALDACSATDLVVLAAIADREAHARGLAADLGFACVTEVGPALAAAALLQSGVARPWKASVRKTSVVDKLRLEGALGTSERGAGKLLSVGADGLAFQATDESPAIALGHARAAAAALRALAHRQTGVRAVNRPALPHDLSAARDVLFGPPRLLSDPASKAALLPFGLPMPQEELCTSPSRAAGEAARIGFPVRIALASPDLRVWDHPDLSVDGVDNAARVRDVYRQLMSVAEERAPKARVLGVTVTATTLARALVRVTARPMAGGRCLLRVGFADPHGAVVRDATTTLLPANEEGIQRAITRLAGHALLLGESAAERERNLHLLSDLFGRVGAFVEAFGREIERVDLHPLALLVGEGAEIREAAIQVTDAFVRELG